MRLLCWRLQHRSLTHQPNCLPQVNMLSKCFLASSKRSFASLRFFPSPMKRAQEWALPFKGKGGETTESNLAAFGKVSADGLGVSIFAKLTTSRFSGLLGSLPFKTAFTRASATL